MDKKSQKGVDTKCWDLAEAFMSDVEGSTHDEVRELAELIQTNCEDACQAAEERVRKENERRQSGTNGRH